MKYKILVLLWIGLANLVGQDIQQLASRLQNISAQYHAIGSSFSLIHNEEVYNLSYGWKDYDRQLRIDSDTKFRIASISKIITAITAMKLVEEGLLDLDSDVSNYLGFNLSNPNYPNNIITLRNLLTHTSGLRDSNAYSSFMNVSYSQNPPAIEELLTVNGSYYNSSLWSSYYAPGDASGWDYSNLSAGVVATIVEIIGEEHFTIYCQDNIFTPLGIEACWNNYSALSDINDLAVLYRYVGDVPTPQADNFAGVYPPEIDLDQIPLGWNGLIYSPQGGLRISTPDLAKIFLMLKNRGSYEGIEILSEDSVTAMEELNWSGSGLAGFFTEMGLQIQRSYSVFDNELFFGHAGDAYGLVSDAYYSLARDIVVIFLTNGANLGYGNVFYDFEEAVFTATQEWLDAVPNVDEVILPNQITIYPNVISSHNQEINIKSPSDIEKISVYNIKGQLVNRYKTPNKQIKLEKMSSGLYFLKIETSGKTSYQKLIIAK